MANALNTFPATFIGANTGLDQRQIDFKNIVGAIIVPTGTTFSQSNTATAAAFLAALQAATVAVRTARAYPINNFGEVKDGSESVGEEKLGYGAGLIVRDGTFKWAFRIIKGGFWLSKALRAFNNTNVDVFFVDSNSLVIGQRIVSSTGVVSFGGIPQYQAYQEPIKINDGSKNTIYMQNFSFPGNAFDNIGLVQLNPGDFNTVLGLQNITLYSGGARVTNVSLVKGYAGNLNADLGVTLGSALALASLWTVQDSVTGNYFNSSTGITSVTFSSSTNTYTITANASDPAYNAGNPVNISLAAASVLDAAGLHYESNSFTTPN
jgi:hypothetical protein